MNNTHPGAETLQYKVGKMRTSGGKVGALLLLHGTPLEREMRETRKRGWGK